MAMKLWNRWRCDWKTIWARHTDAIQLVLSDLVPLIGNTLKIVPRNESLLVPLENVLPRFGSSGKQSFEKSLKTIIGKREPVIDDGILA